MKCLYLLKTIALTTILFNGFQSTAQMVGTNVFLKGRYVEIGSGTLGYFGSDSAAPSGYHPHLPGPVSPPLGFVADPGMTGWSTSSSSHYNGDYFMPGSPFEGWELQVDGKRCQAFHKFAVSPAPAFSYSGGMGVCTGANISHTVVGSKVKATWQGTIDSITMTQVTTLDTNDLFFIVRITLTNTAVAPKNDIYYFRSLDPDNDQTWPGGNFYTNNIIDHQMPDVYGASVVSVTGISSGAPHMALGSADTASRVMIYNCWWLDSSQDLAAVYNQTYGSTCLAYYNVGVNHPGDIGIGLTINVPHLATVDSAGDSVLRTTAAAGLHPANSATFTYFFAFGPDAVDSAIAHSDDDMLPPPLAIKNVTTAADIKVYPNPSRDMVNVTDLVPTDHLALYDMMGRDMSQNWQVTHNGTNTFRYNELPVGSYLLIVTDAGGNIKGRVPVRKQ